MWGQPPSAVRRSEAPLASRCHRTICSTSLATELPDTSQKRGSKDVEDRAANSWTAFPPVERTIGGVHFEQPSTGRTRETHSSTMTFHVFRQLPPTGEGASYDRPDCLQLAELRSAGQPRAAVPT